MLVGNSIFGMAVKSIVFYGKVEMDNIAGVGNRYIPNLGQLNKMTLALIEDKDSDGDKALSAEELGVNEDILKEIDTNDDGNADREELNAAHPLAKFYNTLASLAKDIHAFKEVST